MPDLNAQFEADPGQGEYEAFKVVDRRQVSLLLRPLSGAHHWVSYSTLLRIESADPSGSALLLFFTSLAVSIEGRNLHEVADAIAKGRCSFVEQFDPARHNKPANPHTPLIEHITTYAPEHPVNLKPARAAASEQKPH